MSDDDRPVVLAIDDEARVVEAFELWLGDEYRVLTATSGESGLERLDGSVDVVLLDRHMPGISGEEVLDRIREGPHDPWVAMVTAVDPDFDIVEMPFDEYIPKPVDRPELRDVVDRLLRVGAYDRRLNDLYAVTSKIAVLQAEKTNAELDGDDRYDELLERRDALRRETDELLDAFDAGDLERLSGLLADPE